jgi:uncharacterized protein YyaL (SSP411 family)
MKNKDLIQNSIAADNLLRLYEITKDENYLKSARETLNFFMDKFENYGPHAASYALAVDKCLSLKPSS